MKEKVVHPNSGILCYVGVERNEISVHMHTGQSKPVPVHCESTYERTFLYTCIYLCKYIELIGAKC
jgi:hypothetical protein